MDRQITNLLISKLMIQLDCASFFVVSEEIFESEPDLARSSPGFERALEEVVRESTIDPQLHYAITFLPCNVVIILR